MRGSHTTKKCVRLQCIFYRSLVKLIIFPTTLLCALYYNFWLSGMVCELKLYFVNISEKSVTETFNYVEFCAICYNGRKIFGNEQEKSKKNDDDNQLRYKFWKLFDTVIICQVFLWIQLFQPKRNSHSYFVCILNE